MNIKFTIQKLLDKYKIECGLEPFDINCGKCEEFAQDLLDVFGKGELVCTESYVDYISYEENEPSVEPETRNFPGHVWIFFDDKHYDAECPEGVENFMNLPIFSGERK